MPYAIITGATQGIGKAIAEKLLQHGFSIAVCARSHTDLHKVEAEWKEKYPRAEIIAHRADLSIKQDVLSFARQVLERFPVIDVLVNNAGLYFPGQLATEAEGHMETLMNVNFYSAYHLTRQVLPTMKQKRSGHIFNICSVASLKAYPNGGAYSITKYALLGFSDNLRYELIPDNIKVTAISPGATHSRSWEGADIPEDRIMRASDIAEMVWCAYNLSHAANVEHIVMRPQQGDM
jgi:NADP-dependent 3-hydroxy acid dehydrogenase YdfG